MQHLAQDFKWIGRRAFVKGGALTLLAAGSELGRSSALYADDAQRLLRVGLVTDLHYADKAPAGSRHYRESLAKLQEAAMQFQKDQPQCVVELGDLIDAAEDIDVEKAYLRTIDGIFKTLPGEKHYVLGNHCVQTLTKTEFLDGVGQAKSSYSFDVGGWHLVILDACFRGDGEAYGRNNFDWTDANIPVDQIAWLQADLAATRRKTLVFVHQRLDVSKNHSVNNAAVVRKVLEESGKVAAVLQGHSHENSHQSIGGIEYVVLSAMVEGAGAENSAYSTLDIMDDDSIRITGFRRQADYYWKRLQQETD